MTLQSYADRLEAELQASAEQAINTAGKSYGPASAEATRQLYNAVFDDPTHISGLLTLVGYALEAGQHEEMILQAARAVELLRASASIAGLAAVTGREQAYMTLANLEGATSDDKLKAISICSRSTMLYSHGTMPKAYFINPIHVGMVLAGADCSATDDITPFVAALGTSPNNAMELSRSLSGRWPKAYLLQELATIKAQR